MTCVIPSFTSAMELPTNVSYTIQVGNASGPDLTNKNLTLSVVPDPIFATDGSALEKRNECLIVNVSVQLTLCSCSDSVQGNFAGIIPG